MEEKRLLAVMGLTIIAEARAIATKGAMSGQRMRPMVLLGMVRMWPMVSEKEAQQEVMMISAMHSRNTAQRMSGREMRRKSPRGRERSRPYSGWSSEIICTLCERENNNVAYAGEITSFICPLLSTQET